MKLTLDNRAVNILNHINAGVLYCKNDEYSTILYANVHFYEMIGYEKDEFAILFGNRFAELVIDDVSSILKSIDVHIERDEDLNFEYRMRNKKGEIFWVHDTAKYEKEYDCWYVTIMDITAMKSVEYERERLEFYLNSMPNKIVIYDTDTKVLYKNYSARNCCYYNQEASTLHQIAGESLMGTTIEDILSQAKEGHHVNYETRIQRNERFIGHDRNHLIPIKNIEGEIFNYMQVSEDLLSISDGLTKLPTRDMFEKYYHMHISKNDKVDIYMAIIDIDFFKKINDQYGHHIGDEVIKNTARRLTVILDKEDYICRFGGDEFIILFVDQTLDVVLDKCKYILHAGSTPMVDGNEEIKVSYSIGIASNQSASDYQELFEQADYALYRVKSRGKGDLLYYNNMED